MASNDAIVLKANFEDWAKRAIELKGIQPWLYYCVEQFVKPYSLDDDEIRSGITDGGNDGGADAIYFLVNQRNLVGQDTDLEPKNVSKVRLIIIQSKQSGGFKPTEIEKWIGLTDDFLDLSKAPNSFGERYNESVVRSMAIWKNAYLKLSSSFPEISLDYYYITGDDAAPDDYARDSGKRVLAAAERHIKANCQIHYIGAQQLWEQVQRRPPKARTLTWSETPMQADEGYVGLVRLRDYYDFIREADGTLAERIFESNVRGYQMDAAVNKQIQLSLANASAKGNFWLLNNGVTIISPKSTPAGRLNLSIDDPQIVNGLQTSREIFSYFENGDQQLRDHEKRTVLVRVIQAEESDLQDMIIRATNSQNRMQPASLRMTDQIHRNIEALFKQVDLYYDRRKGFYRDQAKPIRKIVSVNAVVQAVVSILLQRPDDARARPGDYFKDDARYESVFGDATSFPLFAFLSCAQIVRRIEQFLDSKDVPSGDQRNLKFYMAAFLARQITGLERPVAARLPAPDDIAKLDDTQLQAVYATVRKAYDALSQKMDKDTVARGTELLKKLGSQWKRAHAKPKKGEALEKVQ